MSFTVNRIIATSIKSVKHSPVNKLHIQSQYKFINHMRFGNYIFRSKIMYVPIYSRGLTVYVRFVLVNM